MRPGVFLLLASCTSLKLDDAAPFASLRGSPPSLAGRQELHLRANEDVIFVRGGDGVPWALQNPPLAADGSPTGLSWLVRLADPTDTLVLYEQGPTKLTGGAWFQFTYEHDQDGIVTTTHVTMTRPGAPPLKFDLDFFAAGVVDSENEAALYVIRDGTSGYIVRTDGTFSGAFPFFTNLIPVATFDLNGEWLFTFEGDGKIHLYSATRVTGYETIGNWSLANDSHLGGPTVIMGPGLPQLTVCDDLGLRTWRSVLETVLVLDSDPCVADTVVVRRDHLVYNALVWPNQVLRSVPLDGSARPVDLAHADAALAIDAERVAWTTTPGNYPVTDGWVDDKRFMERGRFATFSADGRHLYFLEHAATSSGAGELRSYEIATGITHLLALNARSFAELPDGRLLAVTNAWRDDQWNRVVVIDEARRTIDWVAEGADVFTLIPGSQDVLVNLVASTDGITMARMPIP